MIAPFLKNATILDARGRRRPLTRLPTLGFSDTDGPAAHREHTSIVRTKVRLQRPGLIDGVVVCLGAVITVSATPKLFPSHPPLTPFATLGVILLLIWAVNRWRYRAIARLLAAEYLAQHRCPGCAYPLRCIRSEPDGCTVCPECGGAWRLEPANGPQERIA